MDREDKAESQKVSISVVIPVYNEAATIGQVIERVLRCGFESEVIVVDDGSTDGTLEFLQKYVHPRVKTIYHPKNKGKGSCTAFGMGASYKTIRLCAGCRPRVRPQRFRRDASALVRRPSGHGVWIAFSGWASPGLIFLALRWKPSPNFVIQHVQ